MSLLDTRIGSPRTQSSEGFSPAPLRGGGQGAGGVQTLGRLFVGAPPLPYPSPARREGAL